MLTEKENKMIKKIVSGKLRRKRIFAVTIMIAGFLIILLFSVSIKNKARNELKKTFKQTEAILNNTKTTTRLEKDLKVMVISNEKDIQGIILDLVDLRFNWQAIWFGSLILMVIFSTWRSIILENIIKKYQEEKETKRG